MKGEKALLKQEKHLKPPPKHQNPQHQNLSWVEDWKMLLQEQAQAIRK